MPMDETVIQIEDLWKQYRLGVIGHGTLTHDFQSWWAKVRRKEDPNSKLNRFDCDQNRQVNGNRFWALKEVYLEVKQGEAIGIIGENGAGKSTLLKILSRITTPTRGCVKVRGRISSLLEIGTGFHKELTGRENIFLNGSILGMSGKEVQKKFDEIVDFSGVEAFIDTPVKRYSSGMYMRLAFAVAAHLNSEILLVDEVLAVGDVTFQKKCIGKMRDVSKKGRTVLFVSHNMATISALCERCILIERGSIVENGHTDRVISKYIGTFDLKKRSKIAFSINEGLPAQILSAELTDHSGKDSTKIKYQSNFCFTIKIDIHKMSKHYHTLIAIRDCVSMNVVLFTTDRDLNDSALSNSIGMHEYKVWIPGRLLTPGHYITRIMLIERNGCTYSGGNYLSDNEDSQLAFEILDTDSKRAKENLYGKSAISPEVPWLLA